MATSYCNFIVIMNRNVNNLICNPKGVETNRLRATTIEHGSLSPNKNKGEAASLEGEIFLVINLGS